VKLIRPALGDDDDLIGLAEFSIRGLM